jgi:hypothetical protein
MEITASNLLEFHTKYGISLGIDVASIFDHSDDAVKYYRVTADPYVNVREEPSATSKDIGDKLYGMTVGITIQQNGFGKLYNEPGWASMAWLELK